MRSWISTREREANHSSRGNACGLGTLSRKSDEFQVPIRSRRISSSRGVLFWIEILGGPIMSGKKNPATLANTLGRRKMIGGVAIAIGGLAAGPGVLGDTQHQTTAEHPSTGANQK